MRGVLVVAATRELPSILRENRELEGELRACDKIVSYDPRSEYKLKGVGKDATIYVQNRAKRYMTDKFIKAIEQAELRGAKVVCLDS